MKTVDKEWIYYYKWSQIQRVAVIPIYGKRMDLTNYYVNGRLCNMTCDT